jgi:hypothetical protein
VPVNFGEEFLFGLKAGPAGGRLRRPSSAGRPPTKLRRSSHSEAEVADYAKLLGEDRTPADGFSLTWRYPSQGLSAHLDIQAIGPGGTTDKTFGIAH